MPETRDRGKTERHMRSIRDLYVICSLIAGPLSAGEIRDEYAMTAREVMEESSVYRTLNRLMKQRLVRYASTNKNEVHPSDLGGTRKYALTDEGRAWFKQLKSVVESADGTPGRLESDSGETDDSDTNEGWRG